MALRWHEPAADTILCAKEVGVCLQGVSPGTRATSGVALASRDASAAVSTELPPLGFYRFLSTRQTAERPWPFVLSAINADEACLSGTEPRGDPGPVMAFAAIAGRAPAPDVELRDRQEALARRAVFPVRAPMWSGVDSPMLSGWQHDEVGWVVVPRASVLVMDFFAPHEGSTKNVFHNDPMLKPLFPVQEMRR